MQIIYQNKIKYNESKSTPAINILFELLFSIKILVIIFLYLCKKYYIICYTGLDTEMYSSLVENGILHKIHSQSNINIINVGFFTFDSTFSHQVLLHLQQFTNQFSNLHCIYYGHVTNDQDTIKSIFRNAKPIEFSRYLLGFTKISKNIYIPKVKPFITFQIESCLVQKIMTNIISLVTKDINVLIWMS